MNIDINLGTIFSAVTTGIVGIIGWMLRSIYADFKIAIAKIEDHSIRLAVIDEKVKQLEADNKEILKRLDRLED